MRWQAHTVLLLALLGFALPGLSAEGKSQAYALVLGTDFQSGDVLVWRIQNDSGTHDLMLRVENQASSDSLFVVSLRNPSLRDLTWRWSREGHPTQQVQTGIRFPFRQRPLAGHFFSVPVKLTPGESGVLNLTLDNGGFRDRAVLRWESAASYEASRTRRLLFLSAYSSVAIFTLALGFLILAFIRAYIRFSYLFFFAIGLLAVATVQGVGYAVIWPRWVAWQSVAEPVLLNATFLGGLRFLQRFLRTESILPRGHWVIMGVMVGFGVFALLGLWVPGFGPGGIAFYQTANDAWFLAGIMVCIAAPALVFVRTRQADNLGLLVAYVVLLVAVALGIGEGLGWWLIGRGLETGLWVGGMLLHLLITNVIVSRMRLVVLEQIQSKADLEAHKVRLLRTLVIQEEAERVRIGADLHDEAGSRFASLKMALSGWAFDADPGEAKSKLEDLADKVDALCEANRDLSHQLLAVSLEKLGLEEALQAYRRRLLRKGRHIVFRLEAGVLDGVDETASILLHRVVQELVEGVYAGVPEMRIRLDNLSASREVLLTAEPLDEALPTLDERGPAFRSLATRVALFQENRMEAMRTTNDGLYIWLPKRVAG